jgi:hypothetical protein
MTDTIATPQYCTSVHITDTGLVIYEGDNDLNELRDQLTALLENCSAVHVLPQRAVSWHTTIDLSDVPLEERTLLPAVSGTLRFSFVPTIDASHPQIHNDHLIEAAIRHNAELTVLIVTRDQQGEIVEAWEGQLDVKSVAPRPPTFEGDLPPATLIATGELVYGQSVRDYARTYLLERTGESIT